MSLIFQTNTVVMAKDCWILWIWTPKSKGVFAKAGRPDNSIFPKKNWWLKIGVDCSGLSQNKAINCCKDTRGMTIWPEKMATIDGRRASPVGLARPIAAPVKWSENEYMYFSQGRQNTNNWLELQKRASGRQIVPKCQPKQMRRQTKLCSHCPCLHHASIWKGFRWSVQVKTLTVNGTLEQTRPPLLRLAGTNILCYLKYVESC